MGKLLTIMRSAPKRSSALVAMIAAAVVVPAALFAWGPDRPTFTVENPADHITFNAITNNPDYGDERNFVRIKDASDMSAGNWKDELTVQPGKEYLVQMYVHNNAASSLNLVAQNTRVMANVPNTTGKKVQIDGFITADNATPNRVWDQAIFNSDRDFNLSYVNGSTKFYNNVFGQAGTTLSDSIVTNQGAQVGYDKIDGKVPGCFQFSGYVSFKVKAQVAQTANFTIEKQVRKAGSTGWNKAIDAKVGDNLEYLVTYKNIGDAPQDNVTLKDTLPNGISYVPGSTLVANTTNPSGLKVSDNIVKPSGVNIGNYNGGAAAYVKFSAKVANNDKLPTCGPNTLRNTARIETAHGWKESTADVKVNKDCIPPKDIKVCDLASKKIVTIKEDQFDANKHSKNLKDCEVKPGKITVCELATKKIITIDENKFDASKHSKNLKDCETTPVTPPTTPPELPKTGAEDGVAAALALGALVASASYYIASRRLLGN